MKKKLIFRRPAITAQHRPITLDEYFNARIEPGCVLSSSDLTSTENREYAIFSLVCEAWRHYRERNRRSKGDSYQTKVWVRTMLRHLRASWDAHNSRNDLLAKYEFRTAETYWLRLGMNALAEVAGKAMLLKMKLGIVGRASAARRWGTSENTRNKRDNEIRRLDDAGVALEDLEERYGIGKRRIQQIKKKPKAK